VALHDAADIREADARAFEIRGAVQALEHAEQPLRSTGTLRMAVRPMRENASRSSISWLMSCAASRTPLRRRLVTEFPSPQLDISACAVADIPTAQSSASIAATSLEQVHALCISYVREVTTALRSSRENRCGCRISYESVIKKLRAAE
jgi:hypothetical protein